jgi:hypothetical protein
VPLTFPSHAAAVLPLKLWRPRWFDGVALVIGSGSPDYVYAIDGYLRVDAHTWWGIVWFCVPATMALSALCRLGAPSVATHLARLPGLRAFAVGDYAALGWHRHRFLITLSSAAIGAVSHRLWDLFTHPSLDDGATRVAFVNDVVIGGQPLWHILQHTSTILGGLGAGWMFWRIGRTRRLHEPGLPASTYRPRRFWWAAGLTWSIGLVVQPLLAGFFEPSILVVRVMALTCVSLVAGAVAVTVPDRWRVGGGSAPGRLGTAIFRRR